METSPDLLFVLRTGKWHMSTCRYVSVRAKRDSQKSVADVQVVWHHTARQTAAEM